METFGGTVSPRAKVIEDEMDHNAVKNDKRFGGKPIMGITVNGISVIDIQRSRSTDNKNIVNNKKNTANNRKKKELTPAPSVNKKGDMLKYVTSQKKKTEDNERTDIQTMNNSMKNNVKKNDNMKNIITLPDNKKIVEPTVEQGVAQKINNFKRLSETTKCVIGSGYCSGIT